MVRDGYDKAAAAYTQHRVDHVEPEAVAILDTLSASIPHGSRVLDAGCGGGVISARLTDRFEVFGVDMSIEQLRIAKSIAPRAHLVCQDIATLSPPEGCFAAIVCVWTIIHVPREEHPGVFRRFHRSLAPGGLAFLSVGRTEWEGSEPFFGAELWWSHHDRETSIGLIKQAGFEILRVVDVDDRPGNKRAPFILARKD